MRCQSFEGDDCDDVCSEKECLCKYFCFGDSFSMVMIELLLCKRVIGKRVARLHHNLYSALKLLCF